LIEWDGRKDQWNDADIVDPDPVLADLIEQQLRADHAKHYDRDYVAAQSAEADYRTALQTLIYNCRQQTRVRYRETSQSRASLLGVSTLYYNTDQTAQATCPTGQTGNPVTITIPAGTVSSPKDVADANQIALAQAQAQANAQLVCTPAVPVYYNTKSGVYNATAVDCGGAVDAPAPSATPVQVNIPVGSVSSEVSVEDANTQAQALAESRAKGLLVCRFFNRAQTANATCPSNLTVPPQTATVAEANYHADVTGANDASALAAGQAQADSLAHTDAQKQADEQMAPLCPVSYPDGVKYNISRTATGYGYYNCRQHFAGTYTLVPSTVTVLATLMPGIVSGQNVTLANTIAAGLIQAWANNQAQRLAVQLSLSYNCNPTFRLVVTSLSELTLTGP
jgi:hypothetical protein